MIIILVNKKPAFWLDCYEAMIVHDIVVWNRNSSDYNEFMGPNSSTTEERTKT